MFFSPGDEQKLVDAYNQIPFDLSKVDVDASGARCIEIIQHAGETVFVPSGWHHQVWNLNDTISVNHNWFNACNVYSVWTALCRNLSDVRKEIDDCRDMIDFEGHCQLMLRSLFGMNFESFFDILKCVTENRLRVIASGEDVEVNGIRLGGNHAKYDLKAIENVLREMITVELDEEMSEKSRNLLKKIEENL